MKNINILFSSLVFLTSCVVTAVTLSSPEYQLQSGFKKRNLLWSEIQSSAFETLPETNNGFGISFAMASVQSLTSLAVSFDRSSDFMPQGRKKIIHPWGAVAQVRWNSLSAEYTGLLESGSYGLARLSIAGDPSVLGFIPGMALKLFVDQKPSANLQVMFSLDGQGEDNNVFRNNFSNSIPAPTNPILKSLAALFALVKNPPTYLALNHLTQNTADGKTVQDPKTPYALVFKPNKQFEVLFQQHHDLDFRDTLALLPNHQVLYFVYAQKNASSKTTQKIGELILESSFIASEFGDEKLFFQHNR